MNLKSKLDFNSLISIKSIIILSSIVSIIAIVISFKSGNMLAYNDATAHLNTSRRIVDNLTPGIVQIGSVWLPLLHIFLIPFVSIDFLWSSGLGGALISSVSFIISSVFLYKLVLQITSNKWSSLIAVLVLCTNVNILYLQTTTMFEPLLIAVALVAIYFISSWSKLNNINYLVLGAFFTMLTTLTRYDGWALLLSISTYIFFINIVLKRKGKGGILLLFFVLASFGIFLWLLYNQLIFSDALYFMRGEYSAAAQQEALFLRGVLPTKGNFILSLFTYSTATLLNLGIITTVLALLGLIIFLKNNFKLYSNWAPLILLTPYVFNVVSLYLGQSVIWVPMLSPYLDTYFNSRYGILMLPAAAFFIGYLTYKNVTTRIIVFGLLIIQFFLFFISCVYPFYDQKITVITLLDTVSSVNDQTVSASTYLHDNYDDGLILVSSASEDAFIFRTNIHLNKFITEGTGNYWKESLNDPSSNAKWVVYFTDHSDRVGKVLDTLLSFKQSYSLKYKNTTYEIWKKN